MDKVKIEQPKPEYTRPAISDYGDLQELTASNLTGSHTDVPLGTQGPHILS